MAKNWKTYLHGEFNFVRITFGQQFWIINSYLVSHREHMPSSQLNYFLACHKIFIGILMYLPYSNATAARTQIVTPLFQEIENQRYLLVSIFLQKYKTYLNSMGFLSRIWTGTFEER